MSSPYRFAILGSRGYPSTYGGFETFVRKLAPFLVGQGHEVLVYSREISEERRLDDVRVIPTRGWHTKSMSTLSAGLFSALDVARRDVDAALVLNVANGYFLPILRRAGVRTALNVDGLEWERDKWNRLGKKAFWQGAKLSARYADSLISDSVHIGKYWESNLHRAPTFIPYGADVLEAPDPSLIREYGLNPGGYVLAVARLVPENNIEMLLDAYESYLEPNVPLVIVGSAVGKSPLQERVKGMHDAGRVIWLGHVSNQELLHSLWAHAGVYVHGHSVGGTNPALLSALGCGSPTVIYNTAFNSEVSAGELPEFKTASELADAVLAVMHSSTLQSELSAAGRKIVENRYAWDDVLHEYEATLVRVAGMRTP